MTTFEAPIGSARRPAALFDFDGTLLRSDTTVLLLGSLIRCFPLSLRDLVPMIVLSPGLLAGLVSRDRMKGLAVRALRSIPPRAADRFFLDFHDRTVRPRYSAGALARIGWHRERGDFLVLVSASIDLYLRHAARHLGFDALVCTGASSGPAARLLTPNCRGPEKTARLAREEFFGRTDWAASWAYSDDRSDLPMLELCGHPVAVNPSAPLRDEARRRHWEIQRW